MRRRGGNTLVNLTEPVRRLRRVTGKWPLDESPSANEAWFDSRVSGKSGSNPDRIHLILRRINLANILSNLDRFRHALQSIVRRIRGGALSLDDARAEIRALLGDAAPPGVTDYERGLVVEDGGAP